MALSPLQQRHLVDSYYIKTGNQQNDAPPLGQVLKKKKQPATSPLFFWRQCSCMENIHATSVYDFDEDYDENKTENFLLKYQEPSIALKSCYFVEAEFQKHPHRGQNILELQIVEHTL